MGEWLSDPGGTHEYRWWDGQSWTEHVSDGGVVSADRPTTELPPPLRMSDAPQAAGSSTMFTAHQPGRASSIAAPPTNGGAGPAGPSANGHAPADADALPAPVHRGPSGPAVEYKVLTQKDRALSRKFDPYVLEAALNEYAQEGWRVVSSATAEFPGFLSGQREELIIVLERAVRG